MLTSRNRNQETQGSKPGMEYDMYSITAKNEGALVALEGARK